jgi:hypothetical protein
MKMPLSELIDRYTITQLKAERSGEDVALELDAYTTEIEQYGSEVKGFIVRLHDINGKIWDAEKDIKNRREYNMPLDEIGRKALEVRNLNCERNGIKAEIVEKFSEGFKEIAINYTKVDYGD